jgi:hypothetical protein
MIDDRLRRIDRMEDGISQPERRVDRMKRSLAEPNDDILWPRPELTLERAADVRPVARVVRVVG